MTVSVFCDRQKFIEVLWTKNFIKFAQTLPHDVEVLLAARTVVALLNANPHIRARNLRSPPQVKMTARLPIEKWGIKFCRVS